MSSSKAGYDVSPPLDKKTMSEAEKGQSDDPSKIEPPRRVPCPWCPDVDCGTAKWAILRFVGLCMVALLILCFAYVLKSTNSGSEKQNLEDVYAVGDPIYARDLWLVIELPSDERGRRTHLGKKMARHVCSAIRAGQAVGWTPLVVGGRSTCCRSAFCWHLHPLDIAKMNHTSSMHFMDSNHDIQSALRTAAFLAAIKRGAHFIYHANPEVYVRAKLKPSEYREELEYQLRKMTLGISVGLVKDNPSAKYTFDPYGHFGPDQANKRLKREMDEQSTEPAEDYIIHKYKICEITPPSLEKFLDTDGYSLDTAAPAITLPGEISSPFDSRNTLFGRDAFWSLLLLPLEEQEGAPSRDNYVIRSILGQTVLAEVAGSTKFSMARTALSSNVKELSQFGPRVHQFLDFVNGWSCPSSTALYCLNALISDLVANNILEEEAADVADMWVKDLLHVRYKDIPRRRSSNGYTHTPCIGDDALFNVYFHPAIQYQAPRSPKALTLTEEEGRSLSTTQLNRQVTNQVVQRLCPTVSVESAFKECAKCNRHENILLIVTFNKKDYSNIPLFEVMYRHHFQNILYCGPPDEKVDKYMEQYNGIQGTYFSFLPAHSKTGYECLLGAIEMGFNVDGYMVAAHDTLINSWNFGNLDSSSIWHGNDHVQDILPDNIEEIDPEGGKVMKSTTGILRALEFLEDVLLKSPPVARMKEHMDEDRRRRRYKRDTLEDTTIVPETLDSDYTGDEEMEMDMHIAEMEEQGMDTDAINDQLDTMSLIESENDTEALGSSGASKNWHISLFGEIIQDTEDELLLQVLADDTERLLESLNDTTASSKLYRNVTELLFHPANFVNEDQDEQEDTTESVEPASPSKNETIDHFNDMMFDIHKVYKSISEKLNFWQSLVKSGKRNVALTSDEDGGMLKKDLEQFQCDVATNSEICHLVADFFQVLESNEGANFRLFYDDLPIYYVPSKFKDKLYLMANLFTKYHVADEMAFPLLLRGLTDSTTWTNLIRAEMVNATSSPSIDRPEDLLLGNAELDSRTEQIRELEAAHYIYPTNIGDILTNDNMRNVICRNF
ncbi:hypothetical protein TCAL_09447 [Tigriopus californicus]|uniref:Uncharacterized protein n=1 Tax=Tigriopus californicus TaxID=6832 RepID=A0A553PTP5_TIGCA|nr:uncharacterized protein LOC131891577 [Tigriopus californicus]XP_059097175.1 uncharacterized protein LOC131891577 [Tigriopus californicus]TRY81053.1 hypothetical protein TCAL_09447 [Tigriopus californicus]